MALYAIGDTHLSFAKNKPMNIFGDNWENHPEKLREGFSVLSPDDVCVICGDISWGMGLEEAGPDFLFINSLPGKKIILKGNHDYWWNTSAKIKKFFSDNEIDTIDILHNNSFRYGDYALCGTRGWFYEEEKGGEHDKKIMRREVMRLEASLKSAGDAKKIVFLHYPPIYMNYRCEEILNLLKAYEVRLCCYGHIHGKGCRFAFNGWQGGTEFKLVSADFVNFTPVRLIS
ncbi:MAG: metallophosphoesterase [Candidatus Limivicinus sp.]|jgi:predicted phosphohydrolase